MVGGKRRTDRVAITVKSLVTDLEEYAERGKPLDERNGASRVGNIERYDEPRGVHDL